MKRLIAVLAVLLLLTGCKGPDKPETDTFARDYETEQGIGRLLEDAGDIMEKLTNGTHVVLFAHPDADDKPIVQKLAAAVKEYSGMAVYYYDIENVDDKLANDIHGRITPWISIGYFDTDKPVMFFIGNGELVDYIYFFDSEETYVKTIDDALKVMAENKKPACIDGC